MIRYALAAVVSFSVFLWALERMYARAGYPGPENMMRLVTIALIMGVVFFLILPLAVETMDIPDASAIDEWASDKTTIEDVKQDYVEGEISEEAFEELVEAELEAQK